MAKITVTAKANHYGDKGFVKVGDTFETNEQHAQELVNLGLVHAPGYKEEPKKEGRSVLYKEKEENKTGNVPTAKKTK